MYGSLRFVRFNISRAQNQGLLGSCFNRKSESEFDDVHSIDLLCMSSHIRNSPIVDDQSLARCWVSSED